MSGSQHFAPHYAILRKYMIGIPSNGQDKSKAKDKLSRLPMEHFYEVSQDLTDELARRENNQWDGINY
jgi:hypothetical protein